MSKTCASIRKANNVAVCSVSEYGKMISRPVQAFSMQECSTATVDQDYYSRMR
jgi:hypothetical protein